MAASWQDPAAARWHLQAAVKLAYQLLPNMLMLGGVSDVGDAVASAGFACAVTGHAFDGVVASEVIEHVDGVPQFAATLAGLARPGGGVVVSTISRTQRSYAVAILGAEYLLGLVPRGTHEWERFITPGDPTAHSAS